MGAFNSAKEAVGSFFSWIGDKLSALDGAIESVPVIGSIYRGIKGAGSWVIDKVTGHATGTSYFPGGWTRVNERGGEIMRLPGGTQIIPHDVSRRMAGGIHRSLVTVGTRALRIGFDHRRSLLARSKERFPFSGIAAHRERMKRGRRSFSSTDNDGVRTRD